MSDPPRRPLGRPPLRYGDPSTSINLRLPGSDYDKLYVIARQHRMSVSQYTRHVLREKLNTTDRE